MESIFTVRKKVIEICKLMHKNDLVKATDGNISVRIGENEILITPSGKSKENIEIQDLIVIDFNGKKLSGTMQPSGEFRLHTTIYRYRKDVNAIVHAHPTYATAFSVAGLNLMQCVLPEIVLTLGGVPLADYATLYTEELPQSILKYVDKYSAILLKNHGVVTFDKDLFSAYYKMEKVEHLAQIIYLAKTLGKVDVLTKEQVQSLMKVRERLGLKTPLPDCDSCDKNCEIK
ncbi:MAG: class II aldolase/adducin family protein [Endomicrobiia bacterium]